MSNLNYVRNELAAILELMPEAVVRIRLEPCTCAIENHNDFPNGPQCPVCGGAVAA